MQRTPTYICGGGILALAGLLYQRSVISTRYSLSLSLYHILVVSQGNPTPHLLESDHTKLVHTYLVLFFRCRRMQGPPMRRAGNAVTRSQIQQMST